MKIFILSEAEAVPGYETEHGLSFLIEKDGRLFLFDSGASDLFTRNARQLDLDLAQVEAVILSHGHWDHGNGLQFLEGGRLVAHPGIISRRFRKPGAEYLGLALNGEELKRRFDLQFSPDPIALTPSLYYLGQIPRMMPFEPESSPYYLENGERDPISDDTGLAALTDKGLLVISGCAHSGICNMVEHARKVTGEKRVAAVIGGFHLKKANEQTRQTISYFRQLGVKRILPSHCTMGTALEAFRKAFPESEPVKAGMVLEF